MFVRYVIPLFAAMLLGFAVYRVSGQTAKPPEVQPPTAPARTPFVYTVAGSGIVEPQTENISVGSAFPGVVTKVHVEVGRQVEAGDVLFELDSASLAAEVEVREAAVAERQAQLARLEALPRPEERPAAAARVAEAKANFDQAFDLYERAKVLRGKTVMTEEDYLARRQGFDAAAAQLQRAQADLRLLEAGAWRPDRETAAAALRSAEAQAKAARTELERLRVRAQVAGTVLQVNVRPGEFVGAPPGQALVVLGDVERLHVRVDLDEFDIPRFRPNLAATASLRGHAEIRFGLKFLRVEPYVIPKRSLTGDNTERVDTRVLQVLYEIPARPEAGLYVGQQVDVFLGEGAAAKPNSALKP